MSMVHGDEQQAFVFFLLLQFTRGIRFLSMVQIYLYNAIMMA